VELDLSEIKTEIAPLKEIDGLELKQIFGAGAAWLEKHAPYINSLNVFPVPDGDSGTNMLLTMQAAVREAHNSPAHAVGEISAALAHGALLGARGNSGVILSQIMRGFARSIERKETIGAHEFAQAMVEGSRTAYKGVVKPVEGTILTVIREAADASVQAAEQTADMCRVLERTVEAARSAVMKTPQLLPVLKEAGVVDAGGEGLLVILEGASKYLKGEPMDTVSLGVSADNLEKISREEGWGYDIQFHIRGRNLDVAGIREQISAMGESALVVGDETLVKVHVHAPNPGDIIKFGAEQGPLVNVMIENMQEQYVDFMAGHTADERIGAENLGAVETALPSKADKILGIGTIAVAPGPGLRRIFESLGVGAMVSGGPTMNPSAQDLLTAINAVATDSVIVLPNDKNIILAANQVKELTEKKIEVVPTRTVPQGIAALLAFNYNADLETNAENMRRAAQRIRTVEITRATRSVTLNGLEVLEGQSIGLLDGDLIAAGDDQEALTIDLLKKANTTNAEIITLYYGSDVPADQAAELQKKLQREFRDQEIEIHSGGQPLYPYIVSVE
jgi:DAK2 domain fusion protein YloV